MAKVNGGIAQLGERLPCKQEASGSIPLISTTSTLKTEQRRKMKSKATERSFNESWKKFVIFNCGTSEKMWVYNYNFAK